MSSRARYQALQLPFTDSVVSPDGTRISYDLYDRASRTAVLVIPGFWRNRRHEAMQRVAGFINGEGYAAAVCDLRGHGDSEGIFGFNRSEHHDVAAVCHALLDRRSFDSITLLGFSYGGAIAISTAARHDLPISSLLLISPVADFGMVAPRINPFTIHRHIAFRQAFHRPRFEWRAGNGAKLRALDDVGSIHRPLCLIHVKNDWLIRHGHSVALYERAKEPKELHLIDIPGNYHADRIFNVAADSVYPIMSAFLARYSGK